MAYTTIDNPELYFQTKLYTGNDGTNAITLDGSENMQPDWVWIKSRNHTYSHSLFDSVRGIKKELNSNATTAEENENDMLQLFNSDGFTLGSAGGVNNSSYNYASWNWKAGGSASSNSNGSITSSVSADTTAGFSIVSYTGTGSAATVGHGLSAVPKMFMVKRRDSSGSWQVYHGTQGATKFLVLNQTGGVQTASSRWNNTEPTSSVFTVNTDPDVNGSSATYIAYCFAEKKGYSKFGSYTGNGNADGPFVYTGFKPAWVMFKPAGESADWTIVDNKRNTFNVVKDKTLNANLSSAEHDGSMDTDFLSNGFKIRNANTDNNSSNAPGIIYMAFAESPFVTGASAIPTTAR